jgi:hypothetical protein
MAGAPLLGNVRSDALAIVPNSQADRPLVKSDFRVNIGCTSMRESIAQRLARDAVKFLSHVIGLSPPLFYAATDSAAPVTCTSALMLPPISTADVEECKKPAGVEMDHSNRY